MSWIDAGSVRVLMAVPRNALLPIVVRPSGSIILCTLLQSRTAFSPISLRADSCDMSSCSSDSQPLNISFDRALRLAGSVIDTRALQSRNAFSSIVVTDDGKANSTKPHLLKAYRPIDNSELAPSRLLSDSQLSKALSPILMSSLGRVMERSEEQSWKVLPSSSLTGPSIDNPSNFRQL